MALHIVAEAVIKRKPPVPPVVLNIKPGSTSYLEQQLDPAIPVNAPTRKCQVLADSRIFRQSNVSPLALSLWTSRLAPDQYGTGLMVWLAKVVGDGPLYWKVC